MQLQQFWRNSKSPSRHTFFGIWTLCSSRRHDLASHCEAPSSNTDQNQSWCCMFDCKDGARFGVRYDLAEIVLLISLPVTQMPFRQHGNSHCSRQGASFALLSLLAYSVFLSYTNFEIPCLGLPTRKGIRTLELPSCFRLGSWPRIRDWQMGV